MLLQVIIPSTQHLQVMTVASFSLGEGSKLAAALCCLPLSSAPPLNGVACLDEVSKQIERERMVLRDFLAYSLQNCLTLATLIKLTDAWGEPL